MKVSDWIVSFLAEQGVQQVFELSGGMITHLLDSLCQAQTIDVVSLHHEQSASFAADAAGRLTGVPGVALATSGPGALNLLTGMGGSYFDSSPTVFLTGQVNCDELKGTRGVRQLGFQETDIVSVAKPLLKGAWLAERAEDVPELLAKAFALAMEGRPGPVLIDLPMNVQRGEINAPVSRVQVATSEQPGTDVRDALSPLKEAKRPLLLAGGGVRSGRAMAAYREFVDRTGIPAVHSLMAVDSLPADHPCRVGMIGTYGNRWANLAIGECDLLVVLGSRLDVRQTGSDVKAFAQGKRIIHVDCDPHEVNNRVEGCDTVLAHLLPFLRTASGLASQEMQPQWDEWKSRLRELRRQWPDTAEQRGLSGINPNVFMHRLSEYARTAGAFAVDVGQHQMWAAQSLDLQPHQAFLTSGGMGAMGYALPAAIGATLCLENSPVVAIAGDGAFQINIQELEVVARRRLPVKIIVMNNGGHGMVRQFQEAYFGGRLQSTVWGYGAPDFVKVGEAYGVPSRTVQSEADLEAALAWLWQDPSAPALLQVVIEPEAKAYPKVAFGQPLTVMEPL